MLDNIPMDVWQYILENVSRPTDLKAMCLTSQALRAVATPRLYNKVVLNVCNASEVSHFIKSMAAGGGLHLKHARSLTLLDNYPPPEAVSMNYWEDSLIPSHRAQYNSPDSMPDTAFTMRMILDMFPDNCLHTFRFLSCNELGIRTAESLQQHQGESLQHIHIASSCRYPYLEKFHNLKTVDLWLREVDDGADRRLRRTKDVYAKLLKRQELARLCLAFAQGGLSQHGLKLTLESLAQRPVLVALTSLTLYGVTCPSLYPLLARSISLGRLTNLCLWDCVQPHNLLVGLLPPNSDDQLHLRHFALTIPAGSEEHIDDPLDILFTSCPRLEGLCLQWSAAIYQPNALMERIEELGRTLRLLSLHVSDHDCTLYTEDFEQICSSCPRLEQLGYSLPEDDIMEDKPWSIRILNAIAQLPVLKIVHFRQTFRECGRGREKFMTPRLQRLANAFFRYMSENVTHSKLDALVIGQEMQASMLIPNRDYDYNYTPRHCFIRSEQKDVFGRTATTATLVPSYLLRYETDYAGIMDWHSNWTEPARWMPRIPGRFHD